MQDSQTPQAYRRLIRCRHQDNRDDHSSLDEAVHDLKNLLSGIDMLVASALRQIPTEKAARETLERVAGACREARDLCGNALSHRGRDEPHGSTTLPKRLLNLGELLQEVSPVLQRMIPQNAAFRWQPSTRRLCVEGNRRELNRVLLNLVKNAAEALQGNPGLVTLRSGVTETEAAQPDSTREHFAYLDVSDTGCGMDETTISRLFEQPYSTKEEGHGLGLLSVQAIVAEHHGLIEVKSVPRRGTTIRVLLPCGPLEFGRPQRDCGQAVCFSI